jgi:hypothetical protein
MKKIVSSMQSIGTAMRFRDFQGLANYGYEKDSMKSSGTDPDLSLLMA